MTGRDVEGDAQSLRLMVDVMAEEAPVLSDTARRDLLAALHGLRRLLTVGVKFECLGHAQALAVRDLGTSLGVSVHLDGVQGVSVTADPTTARLLVLLAAEKGLVSRGVAAGAVSA